MIRRRQTKEALENLILSEVGDVRAVYDVSDSSARRTSKVDLAEAAGSKGVGAILGVGISGLVQVCGNWQQRVGSDVLSFYRGVRLAL